MTGSDAEVLLHLYVERGISAITELRGMFGFCLVDFERAVFPRRDWSVLSRFSTQPRRGGWHSHLRLRVLLRALLRLV